MSARPAALDRGLSGAAEWLPMREATALLGVSSPTLRRWADSGRVTAWTTPGGHRRFERSALVSLRAARMGSPDRPVDLRDLDPRLEAPARVLAAALVRCVQADAVTRPAAVRAAQTVAAGFLAAGRCVGIPAAEIVADAHALRLRILEALAASARIRDLTAPELSELLVEAVAVLDPVLERLMIEERVPVES